MGKMAKIYIRMYEPTHLLFYFTMSPSLRCTPNYPIENLGTSPAALKVKSFQSCSNGLQDIVVTFSQDCAIMILE